MHFVKMSSHLVTLYEFIVNILTLLARDEESISFWRAACRFRAIVPCVEQQHGQRLKKLTRTSVCCVIVVLHCAVPQRWM